MSLFNDARGTFLQPPIRSYGFLGLTKATHSREIINTKKMESAAFYPPAPNAFYSVSSESEYTTATDSSDEEDERPSGPIFIQPRVYETAGAGWQPVKVDGDEKDLDFALRKWKGQESSFGKTETLQLKQTNASELGSAAPGAPGPGMRLDDTIMKKLMKGRSLKNTVGQTVDPEENVMSDEEDDDFKRKAGDIYIPGEYLEKNHESWRTPEQIERYRANMAFLNRLKPNDLKPKVFLKFLIHIKYF